MDRLTFLGLFIAGAAIALGYKVEGGVLSNLFNGSALLIVLGGTLGAVMLQTSSSQFFTAIKMLKWVFFPPKYDFEKGISEIKRWSTQVRQDGYLTLESDALAQKDPFVSKGLNLLIDGADKDVFCDAMEMELMQQKSMLLQSSKIYSAMGGYSPTIGILGAVLGLIQAMNFIKQPEMLGAGIATAFVATIYGVGFANLLFIPIAHKLECLIEQHARYHEMVAQGMLAILQGQTPNAIEQKLSAFLLDKNNQLLFR